MSIDKKLLLLIATVILLSSSVYALVTPVSNSSPLTTQYENPQVVSQYDVYMHPVGLPSGSIWNVTVSGITYASSSDLISLALQPVNTHSLLQHRQLECHGIVLIIHSLSTIQAQMLAFISFRINI
jgi:FlaG/FlaF family flagellin (archaellin)